MFRSSLSVAFALAFAVGAGPALADDAPARPIEPEVTVDSAAQIYEMRSPTGATVIARRRLTTTLGAAVYDLLGGAIDPRAPTLTFRARLRYDADYGGSPEETGTGSFSRLVPGFARGPVDLMYGYVEGRRFANGVLGFRLGRQYVTDALGWWSFDGGLVKITTPYWLGIEVYGGLEQRGGLPFSTPRYERDGVWRGNRTDYDPALYPSFQPNDVAPAFGAAVETTGLTWLHGRATFRRVYNTGAVNQSQFAYGIRAPSTYDGTRISSERVGYAVDATLPSLGGVKAGFAYDLYVEKLANVFASVDAYASQTLTVSVDYDYFRPTFDADSIFNFFAARPMNDVGVRAAWDPTPRAGLSAGVRGRAFGVDGLDPMGGGTLAGRYRIGEGSLGARGAVDIAGSGDRVGLDVYGERTLETRYVLSARTGLWQWNDKLRDDRDAVNVGYVLGAGYKLFPRSLLLADFQHDMNRVGGQRFRAMLWLSIAVTK